MRIDISAADVGYALAECGRRGEGWRHQLEQDIASVWGGERPVLACLSVRTGWDLLLTALRLEEGSEVLMTAVTIPDMVRITRRHGLTVVAVDVDPSSLSPCLEQVRRAITPRTRIICLTHLYGSVTPVAPFAALAREAGVLLVEDCAQAFSPSCFRGHAEADVSLFSFGTIKTSTALGGAVLCFRDAALCSSVRRLEAALPVQAPSQVSQSTAPSFLTRSLSQPASRVPPMGSGAHRVFVRAQTMPLLTCCLAWLPHSSRRRPSAPWPCVA